MTLRAKTALITGASRNIGRAIALAFAAEGADLVLNPASTARSWRPSPPSAGRLVFLASDASAYVTGDTIRVMGGRLIG